MTPPPLAKNVGLCVYDIRTFFKKDFKQQRSEHPYPSNSSVQISDKIGINR